MKKPYIKVIYPHEEDTVTGRKVRLARNVRVLLVIDGNEYPIPGVVSLSISHPVNEVAKLDLHLAEFDFTVELEKPADVVEVTNHDSYQWKEFDLLKAR